MGVADVALSVTATVSPVLYAVESIVSQMLSAAWALTFKTVASVKTIATINSVRDFMNTPGIGTHSLVRPYILIAILFPRSWTSLSIVVGQEFQIQNIDDGIIVQICCGWC